MAQVIDAGQQRTEVLAVVDHAADRDAAEADAVVAALAPDQARTRSLPAHTMPGERDLERRVHGLRAGIREEHMVDSPGRDLD